MWGQAVYKRTNTIKAGIIPTRVGTREYSLQRVIKLWDHPHACGDKTAIWTMTSTAHGSSPRVWGQGSKNQDKQKRRKDHPHACGDKLAFPAFRLLCVGSSPRVWGQVLPSQTSARCIGIIPTRVGTSLLPPTSAACIGDHPHACGDKQM